MSQHVAPGAPLRIRAADWNAMLDVAGDYVGGEHAPTPGAAVRPSLTVLVRNATGADRACGDVLALGAVDNSLTDEPRQVNRRPILAGTVPAAVTDVPAVLLADAPSGEVVRAAVAGVVLCKLSVGSTGHQYAGVTAGQVYLTTDADFGASAVLGTPAGTGSHLHPVRLGWLPPRLTVELDIPWTYEPSEADPCVMEPATFAALSLTGVGLTGSLTPP